MNKPVLSIVILNYNTKNLLINCLNSLIGVQDEVNYEVIVIDNGSTDGSVEAIRNSQFQINSKLKIIENRSNLGFAKGNNKARKSCRGKYILFLNSDTVVKKGCLNKTVEYLRRHNSVGALTCKLILPDGNPDKDARRAFITPWIGLVHLFLKLDRIFPKSKLFAGYWYGYIPENETHEVDAIQGAFFLTRRDVLNKVGWFDEDYFLDGEDIDLCWKIKEAGWKIVYFPKFSILHLKGSTKGKTEIKNKNISFNEKLKYRIAGVNSMEIFVKKRLSGVYPPFLLRFVFLGIRILKIFRISKYLLFN